MQAIGRQILFAAGFSLPHALHIKGAGLLLFHFVAGNLYEMPASSGLMYLLRFCVFLLLLLGRGLHFDTFYFYKDFTKGRFLQFYFKSVEMLVNFYLRGTK